jgi:hypothetical protein
MDLLNIENINRVYIFCSFKKWKSYKHPLINVQCKGASNARVARFNNIPWVSIHSWSCKDICLMTIACLCSLTAYEMSCGSLRLKVLLAATTTWLLEFNDNCMLSSIDSLERHQDTVILCIAIGSKKFLGGLKHGDNN